MELSESFARAIGYGAVLRAMLSSRIMGSRDHIGHPQLTCALFSQITIRLPRVRQKFSPLQVALGTDIRTVLT